MSGKPNLKAVLNLGRQAKPSNNPQRSQNTKLIYEQGSTIMINESVKISDKKYKKTAPGVVKEIIEKTDHSQNTYENLRKLPTDAPSKILKTSNLKENKKLLASGSSSKLLNFFNPNMNVTIDKDNKEKSEMGKKSIITYIFTLYKILLRCSY